MKLEALLQYFYTFGLCVIGTQLLKASCLDFARSLNLPDEHIPFYFNLFPEAANKCRSDPNCPYQAHLDRKACWGYEENCHSQDQYMMPFCPSDHRGWVQTKQQQLDTFFTQGDFGFVKQQRKEMTIMCDPLFREDSSLECSKHLRFCRGRNIMINFTDVASRKELLRYSMDVLKEGQIGGYCRFHKERLKEECDQISPLQSWGPELRYFTELPKRPIESRYCDVVIEKPTFLMKIDALNMYHHFCDFFNLYASQHVNASHPTTFSTDVHILIWESYPYHSSFSATWEAFTRHRLWDLKSFQGQTVCFKNVVFPLLPRMIFGLYYNTPLIWGCQQSGLFHAFSKHILHRLKIPSRKEVDKEKVRITFLSRDTQYRRVLNEDKLLRALKKVGRYEVTKVVFNRSVDFKKQLEIVHNSDIFIGVHGAGLTHLLFLPDWGVVFELYNCEDEACYSDLARLRGVKYITWQDKLKVVQEDEGHHPDGGAHAKFTNYAFDVKEFLRLVEIGAKHVRNHRAFKNLAISHDEL